MEAVLIMQFKMRKRRLQLSEKTKVEALNEPQQSVPGHHVVPAKADDIRCPHQTVTSSNGSTCWWCRWT